MSDLSPLFYPKSVAVIGASRTRGGISGELFHNLIAFGYTGKLYPVNPTAQEVQGIQAYPSVDAIPGEVDLAVITIPAQFVLDAARSCARKGVKGLVVISAGFGEIGEEGRKLQSELLSICRAARMRLVGPNCMGILNTDPSIRLNAQFGAENPFPGSIAFMSQSGALGLAVLDYARHMDLGISMFASAGNKADVSGNDLIVAWGEDPNTSVILLYLESFGNPRRFSKLAREISLKKPILAVKSGRSQSGARASASHTGALLRASDVAVDALFRQAGVVRTDTLEELFSVASILSHQPVPRGNRIAILTNAGGPGIMSADTAESSGLSVTDLSEDTKRHLRAFLPSEASVQNPVDMIASAPATSYSKALPLLLEDPSVDSVLVIFIPPMVTRIEDVAAEVARVARSNKTGKPIVGVFMTPGSPPAILHDKECFIPTFQFPETAVKALSKAVRYGSWLELERGIKRPESLPPPAGVREFVDSLLSRGGGWLSTEEVYKLLALFEIELVPYIVTGSENEAREWVASHKAPFVVKGIAQNLIHKSDAKAIELKLPNGDAVANAMATLRNRLQDKGFTVEGFLIQEMAGTGVEMIVGIASDPVFGPVVAVGAGGTLVEVMKDVSVGLTPLSERDTDYMLSQLKTQKLLRGYRGSPPCDEQALRTLLTKISHLAEAVPEIEELDLNPVIVQEKGVALVDARIRIRSS